MRSKDRFRLSLLPKTCELAAMAGVSWETLIGRFPREALLAQTKVLFGERLPEISNAEEPLDILFMPYIGCFQGNNMIQATLARILQARGHRVRMLICDIELPICETTDIATHAKRSEVCSYNNAHLQRFVRATGIESVLVSSLLRSKDLATVTDPSGGERWKDFAEAMLLRYFKVGCLDTTHPHYEDFSKRAHDAALISEAVGRAVVDLAPDRVVSAHGTYTTRGPGRVIINEAGIPHITISRGKIAQTQKFNWRSAGDWWDVNKEWESCRDRPLNATETKEISDYLDSRRCHSQDVMIYNFSSEQDSDTTRQKLGVNSDTPIYTLFTNVLWDAASAQREIVFSNPLEWVRETIAWFADNPDKCLVVRIHPAESVIGTQQPMKELILSSLGEIPSNVKILDPEAEFNSWSLLKVTSIGLVHTSTVGLELALEGKPCICVAKTHYRGKGFTVDTDSKEAYFAALKNGLPAFDRERAIELANRYAHLLFMRYQLPLPFYFPENHVGIRGFKSKWQEMISSTSVEVIVEAIENLSESIVLPSETNLKDAK